MANYTTGQKVADYLGVDLTGLQLTQVDTLLPAADAFIDRFCSRSFGLATAITGERSTPLGGLVYLRNRPVASVQAVRTRRWYIGAPSTALVALETYELVDPTAGILVIGSSDTGWPTAGWAGMNSAAIGGLLEVDYTPAQTTPADITLAASMLVAHWLRPHLVDDGVTPDVKQYMVGQELQVTFRDDVAGGAPPAAEALLAPYRQVVFC